MEGGLGASEIFASDEPPLLRGIVAVRHHRRHHHDRAIERAKRPPHRGDEPTHVIEPGVGLGNEAGILKNRYACRARRGVSGFDAGAAAPADSSRTRRFSSSLSGRFSSRAQADDALNLLKRPAHADTPHHAAADADANRLIDTDRCAHADALGDRTAAATSGLALTSADPALDPEQTRAGDGEVNAVAIGERRGWDCRWCCPPRP